MTTLAPEDILRAAETLAGEVEGLAAEAAATESEELRARLWAKRQRLLIELEVAGVFDARPAQPRLAAYHDAAVALRSYLSSAARTGLAAAPHRLLESQVSLDWFRVPGSAPATTVAADDFLAWCEDVVSRAPRSYGGDGDDSADGAVFASRYGHTWVIEYRREVGTRPVLYRAGREDAAAAPVPVPASFDPELVGRGDLIALDHNPTDHAWFVAFATGDGGAKMIASKQVALADRDGWVAELTRRGVAGGTYAGSGIAWAASGERFTIWLPGARIVKTRAELSDVIGTSSIASDDYVDRMVRLHRRGGRVEALAIEHDDIARVDPTYGRAELLESDGRWCAYCARDLARWLRVGFEDETFGVEAV